MSVPESDMRALLEAVKHEDDPTDADRARIRTAVLAKVAAAAALTAATSSAASASATTGGAAAMASAGVGAAGAGGAAVASSVVAGVSTKVVLLVVAVGGVVGTGIAIQVSSQSTGGAAPTSTAMASTHVEAPPPSTAATRPGELPPATAAIEALSGRWSAASVAPEEAPMPPVEAPAPTHMAPPAMPGSRGSGSIGSAASLEAETLLLRRAHAALTAGRPEDALDLLREHARRYPEGLLAEERSATRVVVLCKMGRLDAAKKEAVAFSRAHPGSPMAARIRAACPFEADLPTHD